MPQSCTPCKNDAQGQRFCYVMSCTVQIIALHTVRYRPNDNVILSSQSITLFYNMTAISKEELLEAGLEVAGFKGWQKYKLKTMSNASKLCLVLLLQRVRWSGMTWKRVLARWFHYIFFLRFDIWKPIPWKLNFLQCSKCPRKQCRNGTILVLLRFKSWSRKRYILFWILWNVRNF